MEDFSNKDQTNSQSEATLLDNFQSEMAEIKKNSSDPHWPEISVEELTDEDRLIWEEIKNFKNEDESESIKDKFQTYTNHLQNINNPTRSVFRAWLGNELQKKLANYYINFK